MSEHEYEDGGFEVNLNFGDVEDLRKPAPDGVYLLRVKDCKKKPTAKGGEQISVQYEIRQAKDGSDEYAGKWVWDNWMLLPQSRWWIQGALEALTGEEWRDDNMKLNLKELMGLETWAVVEIDEYQGKVRNKVSKYLNEPVSSTSTPAPAVPF